MMLHKTYPWRSHNQFTLLVDADEFYPVMFAAIDQARHFILLEQYLVSSGKTLDRFIEHLQAAGQRGVTMLILLDDYGSREISREDHKRLQATGAKLAWYNPLNWRAFYRSLKRDHRKLLLVDNAIAFVGGAGLTDDYLNQQGNTLHWHDVMLQIQGAAVADWFDSFMTIWQRSVRYTPPFDVPAPAASGDQLGQIYLASGPGHNDILRSAIARIKKTNRHIWIATPYFVTSRKFRRALRRAVLHGVDVRLLLPGPITDHPWVSHASRRFYRRLLRYGIRIFEYQPRFIHAKLILCDDWVSIGSSNLDRWNHSWNLDANQVVLNPQFSQVVKRLFEADFDQSRELTFSMWNRRSLRQRLREHFYGYYVTALHWFVYILNRLHKSPRHRHK